MKNLQTTLDSMNKSSLASRCSSCRRICSQRCVNESQHAGLPAWLRSLQQDGGDMQRLDQVLRELQPVLKTLNRRVTRWYLKRRTKKIQSRRGETMKKWLVTIAALWLAGCSSAKLIKTITSYLWCRAVHKVRQPGQSSVMGRAGHCS